MKKGFTLIELLVVVLIIGILAAVALPQYTKAVEKSRATEAITLLGNLATAEQIYKMGQGAFTNDLTQLDLQLPGVTGAFDKDIVTKNFKITITTPAGAAAATGTTLTAYADRVDSSGNVISSGDNQYTIKLDIAADGTITRTCQKSQAATDVTAMCKSIANGDTNGKIK